MRMFLCTLLFAALIMPAPRASAQPAATLSELDVAFITAAGQANNAELDLSQLATQRARRGSVRDFAQRMVSEHINFAEAITALTELKGLQEITTVTGAQFVAYFALQAQSDRNFDRHYLQQLIIDHQAAIQLYSAESVLGSDPDPRLLAETALPVLERHLRSARRLLAAVEGGQTQQSRRNRRR